MKQSTHIGSALDHLADAILDRIVHSSHRIELKGATLRDKKQDQ